MSPTQPFYFYDTRQRKKIKFSPKNPGEVSLYSCGPTVYNVVHIGNIRAILFYDTLQRWLQHGKKYQVQWVMNITDVDDKTIRDSKVQYPDLEPMQALKKFTEHYADVFLTDIEKVGVQTDDLLAMPKATDYIDQMQELIQKIIKNGYGYVADGSIYLDLKKYRKNYKYGQLTTINFDEQMSTKRVEDDEYEKENISDFVLWKGAKQGEPFWTFSVDTSTSLGDQDGESVEVPGRPGWHIECSAMSKSLFPDFPFDIHIGGIDLCFPHHEDEICQAQAGYDVDTATYWMHNEHLMVEGKKMSKSLGNFYTLGDLEKKGISAEVIRFFLVTNHYRTKVNLSDDSLAASGKMLERIRNFIELALERRGADLSRPESDGSNKSRPESDARDKSPLPENFLQKFYTAMDDDLNVSVAIAEFFQYTQAVAAAHTSTPISDRSNIEAQEFIKTVELVESVFGVRFLPVKNSVPQNFLDLLEKRNTARAAKNWTESDRIRDILTDAGYTIRDSEDGAKLLKK